MKYYLWIVFSLLLIAPARTQIIDTPCIKQFYAAPQERKAACIDAMLKTLPNISSVKDEDVLLRRPDFIYFFSSLFLSSPEMRTQILGRDSSLAEKTLFFYALNFADLQDEAQTYAQRNALGALQANLQKNGTQSLKQYQSRYAPSDNANLIAAYFASGDPHYVKKILENYHAANDDMARDGLRLGLFLTLCEKSDVKFDLRKRRSTLLKNICAKYDCQKDPKKMQRVMTLGETYAMLASLEASKSQSGRPEDQNDGGIARANGEKNAPIKKILWNYFNNDLRLNALYKHEMTNFENYISAFVGWSDSPDNPADYEAMLIYENLGSSQDMKGNFRKHFGSDHLPGVPQK